MSTSLTGVRPVQTPDAIRFASVALGFAVLAAALAGWAPVQFSIATVFLFAGPHNWIEARYFLARLPSRWGRSRAFFALSIGGAVALAASYTALPLAGSVIGLGESGWVYAIASWNTAVVLWIVAVGQIHARQTRRDWSWLLPAGLLLVSLTWLAPYLWSLALVYLHPLVSLWFLDRELRRRPTWRAGYRMFLACLPIVLAIVWMRLAEAPAIPGDDGLTLRIVHHAGADLLPGVSSRLLVATHTFLETIHYGVWLVAMPLVGFRNGAIPLARRSSVWSVSVRTALAVGAAAVVVLWVCFAVDYPTTRDVYFTLAIMHVLVEAPFLIRLL